MVGLNSDRFEQLSDNNRLKQELLCGICHEVIDNAIQTQCKHDFCNDCLKTWLMSNNDRKECPECRQTLTSRKRKRSAVNSNDIQIVANVWVEKNRKLNNIIGSLNITCDYHWNGCNQVIPLESLNSHLNECQYKLCQSCGFNAGQSRDEHNCIELLKNEINEMLNKYKTITSEKIKIEKQFENYKNESNQRIQKIDNKFKEVVTICQTFYHKFNEQKQLKKNMEKISKSLSPEGCVDLKPINDSNCCIICDQTNDQQLIACCNKDCVTKFHISCLGLDVKSDDFKCPNCMTNSNNRSNATSGNQSEDINIDCVVKLEVIMFGTFRAVGKAVEISVNGIKLINIIANANSKFNYNITFPYQEIQQIMYNNDPSLSLLVLLVCENPNQKVNMLLPSLKFTGEEYRNSGFIFNTKSNDTRERYIILKLTQRLSDKFINLLKQTVQQEGDCVCVPITNEIKQLFNHN